MFQEEGCHILHSYPFIHDGPQSTQQNKRLKTKHRSSSKRNNNEIKVPKGVLHIKPTWKPVTLDEKPPFSYATIIAHAILSSPERKLTLSEIYQWISEQYPCYSIKDHRWQNSIRHNLSLQKAFVKLDRDSNTPTSGKGCYWTILAGYEQQFIDNLMKHDKTITKDQSKRPDQKKKSSHLFTIFRMTTKDTTPPPPQPKKEEKPQPQDDGDSDCDSGIDLDCTTTTTTTTTKIPTTSYIFPQQNDVQDMLLFNTYMDQSLYLLDQPTLDQGPPLTPLPTYATPSSLELSSSTTTTTSTIDPSAFSTFSSLDDTATFGTSSLDYYDPFNSTQNVFYPY